MDGTSQRRGGASREGGWLRKLALLVLSCVALLVVAGVSLTRRGRAEMDKSDAAFHAGDVRAAAVHAKAAALAYVPGSEHVLLAYERLEAVAKGAESKGDLQVARWAWETLRAVHAETRYPGRPLSAYERAAEAGIARTGQAMDRQGGTD